MLRRRLPDAKGPPAGRASTARGSSFGSRIAAIRLRIIAIRLRIAGFPSAREGATAVEFALIGLPFLCLVAAITETALAFFAAQVLDNAVSGASRQLYTGQFQAARATDPPPPADTTTQQAALKKFKDAICKSQVAIFSCSSVKVDVLTLSDGDSFTPTSPINAGSRSWRTDFGTQYQDPGPGQIVIVQAAVEFPVFFGFLNPNTLSNGKRVLQSTVAFRTEPFQ
ncbi:pilus assembly protein [Methylobacterium currus]|uniref:Pilus assembly protein n=1 Tax=Methylobacterium currus TaxID=2051553 RepID=A0A2R4WII8_9HYPH|nr:TadE/TadG family type IV pilus assembly protein [Methylobacterium currus]AWB21336.1 pilus assembly protein [Methylobacterium currus]